MDNKIWSYNLKDDLVTTIVTFITEPQNLPQFNTLHRYDAYTVPGLLEESVVPDLKKLGLECLIPQLQEALIEEYKKDLPNTEIYKVRKEDMYLYLPDFNKKIEKNHFEKNGISLEDFALIDKTVSALNRQSITKDIKDELYPVKKNNKEEKDIIL